MTVDHAASRSRRAVLAAAIGGVAALAAQAIGRPLVVNAADGDDVLVGGTYTATNPTKITNAAATAYFGATTTGVGVLGESTGSGHGVAGSTVSGDAVRGVSSGSGFGVRAIATGTGTALTAIANASGTALSAVANGAGNALTADAQEGRGVVASSDGDSAVHASTPAGDRAAVFAWSNAGVGTGVFGYSGNDEHLTPARTGVYGISDVDGSSRGVWGYSPTGTGVYGSTGTGSGVHAYSGDGLALRAHSEGGGAIEALGEGSGTPAVIALNRGNHTGVMGSSGPSNSGTPTAPVKTGVFGIATQDFAARGVHGKTTVGQGVRGEATTGFGVRGVTTGGTALSGHDLTGYALRTDGRIKFDKSAGSATVAAGSNSVLVTPGIVLTTSSTVLATLQGSAGGTTTVHRVAINTTTNQFRIYLTANANTSVKVGWLVCS